ncbi:MAG: M23 family metallopeptidase [Bacteroidota bacterium]
MKNIFIGASLMLIFFYGNSQGKRIKHVTDTLTNLACPLQNGIMKSPSQEGYGYKGDVKMVVTSVTDTLLLSPVDGKIDLISPGEGGKYEVVMHHNDYNIWLTGVSKVLVKKNDELKKGQPLGKVKPGDEIELLLFNDEEPVDPKKYLDCKTNK